MVRLLILLIVLLLSGCDRPCIKHRFKVGDVVVFKGLGTGGVVVSSWCHAEMYDLYMSGYGVEKEIPGVVLELQYGN